MFHGKENGKMIRDITIGQYYNASSVIHGLDPRVKIAGTFVYVISLFVFKSILGYLVVTLFLALCIFLSKIPLKYILRGMKSVFLILLMTVFFQVFLTKGENILFKWKFITISLEGIKSGIFFGMRLIYLVLGTSLMTFTTTPNRLTDGLESLLHPLTKFRVPVHEIAMTMSIALRFIPILLEELDKIMDAQKARGADFENGGLIKRTKALIPVLVPLFVSAFRRADELALAMEARCYTGGEGRTKMKPLKYKAGDIFAYFVVAGYLVGLVFAGRWLGGMFSV